MKKVVGFIVFLLLSELFIAQGEGNNWYFGVYAGITFNTSPPSILNNGKISTSEGCAAVSDKDGNLVFYTDGSYVFDANHNQMPNGAGLYGNPSSTQSSVVCPKPGTYNYALRRFDRYYIVTIDAATTEGIYAGVRYTEVDMTANGGLGDVIPSVKNVHLFGTSTTEGVNVAKHANGCDYWIIGKEVGTKNIYTYLITSAGVNSTPVVSTAVSTGVAGVGSIKVSPNNKLVSILNNTTPSVEVYDFDNATGVLTSKFYDNMPWVSGYRAYSSEFSPNNQLFYTTTLNNRNIYQYDLTAPNNSAFVASRTVIGTTSNTIGYDMCGLQLAPNGKIYAALQGAHRLGAIENPNVLGVGCSYNDNSIAITGLNQNGSAMNVRLGLPAFPSFFIFPNQVQYESANFNVNQYFCSSDSITFKLSDTNSVQSVDWFLSDVNQSFPSNPNGTGINYTTPPLQGGTYKILSVVSYLCFVDSLLDTITVNVVPNVNLGNDIDTCLNGSIILDATLSNIASYQWNSGATTPTLSVSSSGQYNVSVVDNFGCLGADTVQVTINEVPSASFLASPVCEGDTSIFTNTSTINVGSIVGNSWDFGNGNFSSSSSPHYLYPASGTYTIQLVVTSNQGCTDTVNQSYSVYPNPIAVAGVNDTLNCFVDTITLDGSLSSTGANFSSLWTTLGGNIINGANSYTPQLDKEGWYVLTITNSTTGCTAKDSVEIIMDTLVPQFEIGNDTLLTCAVTTIGFTPVNYQNGNFDFVWSTDSGSFIGTTNLLNAQVNEDGHYYLQLTNNVNHCVNIDTVFVGRDTIHPSAFAGVDTLIDCLTPVITILGSTSSTGNLSFAWEDATGTVLSSSINTQVNQSGIYVFRVTNTLNGCFATDTLWVAQNDSAYVELLVDGQSDSLYALFSFEEHEFSYLGDAGTAEWSIDNGSFSTTDSTFLFQFEESGEHVSVIALTNAQNGCIAYDTVYFEITHKLEIPTGVSPNSDGINDVFFIRALENYKSGDLTIFNRWGDVVYSASPYANDWRGQTNVSNVLAGTEVIDGTYFYVLKLLTENDEEVIRKGYIELKRK